MAGILQDYFTVHTSPPRKATIADKMKNPNFTVQDEEEKQTR